LQLRRVGIRRNPAEEKDQTLLALERDRVSVNAIPVVLLVSVEAGNILVRKAFDASSLGLFKEMLLGMYGTLYSF
jgi:hypothetical protein